MALIAVGKNLLIEPKVENKTEGGIHLPDEALPAQQCGTVLSIGDEVTKVKVGDVIWYRRYNGTEVNVRGKKVTVLPESEIFFIDTKGVS